MRLRSLAIAILLALASGRAQADAALDRGTARFDAAIALEGQGQFAAATAALESFARDQPTHALADDALAEAAQLCETRLYDPARALALWTLLAERYPDGRNAQRAGLRRAELERTVREGGDDVGAFDRIIGEAGSPVRPEARAQMMQFLRAHPTFPHADRAYVWLAQDAEAMGNLDEAETHYVAAMILRGPEESHAARARADLLLRRGRLDEADAAYTALAQLSDPVARLAQRVGLLSVRRARRFRQLRVGAIAFLVLFALATLLLGRHQLLRVSPELRFFAPVAVLFALFGLFKGGLQARAIGLVAGGAILVIWLMGAARLALAARNATLPKRLLLALAAVIAIAIVAVLAIQNSQLTDFVLDTLRAGPDRS